MSSKDKETSDLDRYMEVMKNNTVLDCQIMQLKSYINALTNQLKEIQQQINNENAINKRLATEVEMKQAEEIQTRNRMANVHHSKQLINKLCNDLVEKVNFEKRSNEAARKLQENTIKDQLARWEEYEKLYDTLPAVKEVKNAEIEIKKVEIEKKRHLHELDVIKKKIEEREKIQEKIRQIIHEKQEKAKLQKVRLIKKKEELSKKRTEQLKLIEDLKAEKAEVMNRIKKEAENYFSQQLKRTGSSSSESFGHTNRENFKSNTSIHSSTSGVPDLPQLQLPQISGPSRKIRRIDTIDTTLKRPNLQNFMLSKSMSQPLNHNKTKFSALRTITSQAQNINQSNVKETEQQNYGGFQQIRKNVNKNTNMRSLNPRGEGSNKENSLGNVKETEQQNYGGFQQIRKNVSKNTNMRSLNPRGEGSNKENSSGKQIAPAQRNIVKPLVLHRTQESSEGDHNVQSSNKGTAERNDLKSVEEINKKVDDADNDQMEIENIGQDNAVNSMCSGNNYDNQGKLDDGYYSQSISSQSQSFESQNQNLIVQMRSSSQKNDAHCNEKLPTSGDGSVIISQSQQGSKQVPNMRGKSPVVASCSKPSTSQASDETTSKYFVEGQNQKSHAQNSSVPPLYDPRTVFKSPPPPPLLASRRNNKTSTPSNSTDNGLFGRNQPQKTMDFTLAKNRQDVSSNENVQESSNMMETHDYLMSPRNDSSMSSWMSPPPHNEDTSSPPDMPSSYGESYLNLLSPPQSMNSPENPGSLPQNAAEPPRAMNMFGGPSAQSSANSNSVFSFTSKLSTPSSLFSMFK